MSEVDDRVLLSMANIKKSYPGVDALKGVDFELRASEIHVLLGENGAGKSTLIKILSGAEQMDDGSIQFFGELTNISSPLHAKDIGICTVYQEFMLVPQLTVAENIHLGLKVTSNGIVDWKKLNRSAQEVINQLGFEIDVHSRVSTLGVHEQQVVEIAKALALETKILVLDEPTAALTDNEIKRLFEILLGLRQNGVGIIYISHNLEEVKRIGDRATVLRDGQNVATVALRETSIEELPQLMVGEAVKDPFPKFDIKKGKEILKVRNCSDDDGKFRNVSFDLHAGEILAFAGLLGSGDVDFVRTLLGLGKHPSGNIELFGKPYAARSPHEAIEAGLFYLPADRKSEGLILPMSVNDNATLAALNRYVSSGVLSLKKQAKECEELVKKLDVRTPSVQTRAKNLSGGNQQKVMIARSLSAKSKIFIFNEPTRGVDIKGKVEIYKLLNQLAEEGAGVIFVSHDLSETIGMSDRILIWRSGEIIESIERANADKEMVLSLITGV